MTSSAPTAQTAPLELPSASRIIVGLSLAVSPLGAALAFVLQPMMGKLLLPRLGGTAATWLGAALFFQISLLLGYAWGLWLARRPVRFQVIAIIVLAIISVATFHAPEAFAGVPSIGGVGLSLSLACLPAMVLLFSLSPWLHSWRERLQVPEPYALYAISNIGSLGALLAYPVLIEPLLGLSDQLAIWRGFLILLSAIFAGAAVLLLQAEKRSPSGNLPPVAIGEIPLLSWPVWLFLSALTCAVMLAAIQLIAGEIGSVPLAWVGPLGVYLASFALIFSGRWQAWMTGLSVVGLALSLAAYMTLKGFGAATVDGACLVALVACCGFASLTGNALLYASRPARGGEWFYLALGVGGAIGGLGSIWLVPTLFFRPVEFATGSAVLLGIALFRGARHRHPGTAFACLAIALGPVLILGMKQADDDRVGDGVLAHYRDIYGHLMVKTNSWSVILSSATTTHGTQLIDTVENRLRPTLYFTENSAIGRTIIELQAARPSIRLAVVGLGAGTLAAYARPSDQIVFYDIDPKIESVARTHFSYLADCRGQVRIEIGDGRRVLADSQEDFDLIAIDAFMGDGIPSHLITREALEIYEKRIRARDGIIIVNASLRYSNLYPVLAATAQTLRLDSLMVGTEIHEPGENIDLDPTRSSYILIGSAYRALDWNQWFNVEDNDERVVRTVHRLDWILTGPRGIWTDDRSAALDVLDPAVWLSPVR